MLLRTVMVFDGPPGAGKTTIVRWIAGKYSAKATSLKAFGFPTYYISSFLVMLRVGLKPLRVASRYDYHPLSLIDKKFLYKIRMLIIFSEFICRFFYFIKLSLLSLLSPIIIVDEGFVNDFAFYYWFYRTVGPAARILLIFHFKFMEVLMKHHHVILMFVDAPQPLLIKRWFKRGKPLPFTLLGFTTPYLTAWCNIIRASGKVLSRLYHFYLITSK